MKGIQKASQPDEFPVELEPFVAHNLTMPGRAKSHLPLKDQIFKSQPLSMWTPVVKRTASWNGGTCGKLYM